MDYEYEFVYKVVADGLQKGKKATKKQPSSAIRSVCLKESQLSEQVSDQLDDLEEWTGFGKVVSFKDETERSFRVLLLDFLPVEIEKGVQAIRPQMATFNHATLSVREIEREIAKMLDQWKQNKSKLQSAKAGLKAHQKQIWKDMDEEMPLAMRIFMEQAMDEFFRITGDWRDVPLECMWEYLDEDKAQIR